MDSSLEHIYLQCVQSLFLKTAANSLSAICLMVDRYQKQKNSFPFFEGVSKIRGAIFQVFKAMHEKGAAAKTHSQ